MSHSILAKPRNENLYSHDTISQKLKIRLCVMNSANRMWRSHVSWLGAEHHHGCVTIGR